MNASPSNSANPRPGDLIAERYTIEVVLSDQPPRRHYVALEQPSGRRVELVELPTQSAVAWTQALTIEHPGVCPLIATLSRHGASFGIFEHVPGRSLSDLAADGVRFDQPAAVRSALWLVEALERLRRAGIVHGGIGPDSIVFRSDDPESVLLTYRGALPEGSPFRPPERALQDPAQPSDDVWGLGATLFLLLSGRMPPHNGVYSEEELRAAGIDDDVLRGVIAQALAAYPSRRSERLASLRHPLAGWLARRAQRAEQSIAPPSNLRKSPLGGLRALSLSKLTDDPDAPAIEYRTAPLSEPPPPSQPSTEPAPVAPPHESGPGDRASDEASSLGAIETSSLVATSSAPALAEAVAAKTSTRRGRRVWLALAGAGLIAGAFVIVAASHTRLPAAAPSAIVPRSAIPAPADTAASAPVAPPRAPAKHASAIHRVATESTGACVERHLPQGSFNAAPDMEFLCKTHDPRRGDHLLRAALATAATDSPALRMWNSLTWYGLPGYVALREACCPDAPPIELPVPGQGCAAIGPLLDDFAEAAVSNGDVDYDLEQFQLAVTCELEQHRAAIYWRKDRPGGAEPTTLRGLLASVKNPRPPR